MATVMFEELGFPILLIDPPMVDELSFGFEHALLPEFMVGVGYTWRERSDILETDRLLVFDCDTGCEHAYSDGGLGRPVTRDDFEVVETLEGELPDGTPYSVPRFDIREDLYTNTGYYLYNGDRKQTYNGYELFAVKRLANNWMLRADYSWNNWEWPTWPTSCGVSSRLAIVR